MKRGARRIWDESLFPYEHWLLPIAFGLLVVLAITGAVEPGTVALMVVLTVGSLMLQSRRPRRKPNRFDRLFMRDRNDPWKAKPGA